MSSTDLTAVLAQLEANPELCEKLKNSVTLDSAVDVIKQAGISISKADLIRLQASRVTELSDEDLEKASGGNASYSWCAQSPDCY